MEQVGRFTLFLFVKQYFKVFMYLFHENQFKIFKKNKISIKTLMAYTSKGIYRMKEICVKMNEIF